MKPFYFLILLLAPSLGFGQLNAINNARGAYQALNSFYNIVGSEPILINNANNRSVDGTPFFSETWMKGIITMRDGKSYRGHGIRLDLTTNKVHFLTEEGKQMLCNTSIERLILMDSVKDAMFSFIHTSALPKQTDLKEPGWLEIMTQGTASLLKFQKKEREEVWSYTGPPSERIKAQKKYYVLMGDRMHKVSSIGDIRDVFKSHAKELDEYIRNEKPSWKNDADLIALVAFYNSLPAKQ
ncbi:MAG TPA: hypothetical protein VD993_15050 [Chitinophagaceae bacterium]|nr:hypothetical protein [Chitinophagaceae bacterium]